MVFPLAATNQNKNINLYLSIIIPVYKSEAYLSKCIESVLNQDYDLYEVILINDGSPDNCGSICDLYASNNAKVSVIHQNNLGVSAARNNGIQKAKGKLFPFGFLHLLQARKNSKDVLFYLIGVHPEYQNKGVTAVIFKEYHKTFTEKGIQNCIRTPELADNLAIQLLWKNFNPTIHCRRKTFRKELL